MCRRAPGRSWRWSALGANGGDGINICIFTASPVHCTSKFCRFRTGTRAQCCKKHSLGESEAWPAFKASNWGWETTPSFLVRPGLWIFCLLLFLLSPWAQASSVELCCPHCLSVLPGLSSAIVNPPKPRELPTRTLEVKPACAAAWFLFLRSPFLCLVSPSESFSGFCSAP